MHGSSKKTELSLPDLTAQTAHNVRVQAAVAIPGRRSLTLIIYPSVTSKDSLLPSHTPILSFLETCRDLPALARDPSTSNLTSAPYPSLDWRAGSLMVNDGNDGKRALRRLHVSHSDAPGFCSTCQIVASAPPFLHISHQELLATLPHTHTYTITPTTSCQPSFQLSVPIRAVGTASLQPLTADYRCLQRALSLYRTHSEALTLSIMDNRGITSVLNFRDVGSTVNKFLGRRYVIFRLIYPYLH